MKAVGAEVGRVFVLRLEDGDEIPGSIEEFARDQGVREGVCWVVGGIGSGRVVTGPRDAGARPVEPLVDTLQGVHEIAAVGTLFPDEGGVPRLHMHGALGREGSTRTGCVRLGLEVWQLGEVVLLEILGAGMVRRTDPSTGFSVLVPGGGATGGERGG